MRGWLGEMGEVQGEMTLAGRWNFWTEDGQAGRVQLLNGLGCHCNEMDFLLQPLESQGRIVRKGHQEICTLEW